MKLSALLVGTDVVLRDADDIEVSGIAYDSRRVKNGDVFVALSGTRTDGSEYVIDAAKSGAAVYIGEKRSDGIDILQLITYNPRRTLAFMYANFYGNPQNKMRIVGITGTNGKTSTAYMLKTVLAHGGYRTALIGTVKSMIGEEDYVPKLSGGSADRFRTMTTPDPDVLYMLLGDMVNAGVEVVVMEISSHALALEKVAPINFEIGVFTNLSEEHLDFHKNMEDYLAAKAKLFNRCKIGIFNTDDEYADRIMAVSNCEKVSFGINKFADYSAEKIIVRGDHGSEYVLRSKNAIFKIKTTIPGRFTLYNTLAAAVAARCLKVNLVTIQNAIYALNGICGRLERVKLGFEGNKFTVFIDYAHTPFALENLLGCVREFADEGQRIVTLFGCGGDRDKEKRGMMGKIAVSMSDFVIITSDNPRSEEPLDIINDILCGVGNAKNYVVIENRRCAIEYAIETASEKDIILLVGKGHEQYEIDKEGIHPFSEIEIAERAAEKRE